MSNPPRPHSSSAGGAPLPPYSNSNTGPSGPHRFSSYASVVQGSTSISSTTPPSSRSAVNFMGTATGSYPPAHSFTQHSRHPSRGMETDSQHLGLPSSWGKGEHSSYSNQWPGSGNGFDEPKVPPFFIPSYLRGSRHAQRIEEAHKSRLAAQRDSRLAHSSNGGSLSTSSSSINIHKMVPSHRGMTHDIIERAVPLAIYEDTVSPLPSRWSSTDKFSGLDLAPGGLEARFNGLSKTHEEAAAVRADHPMPRECGIFYFEVTVGSKNKESLISIGFSGPKVTLNRLPGWEPESWAYHGDDGQTFCCTASGKSYGPKYGNGDVIGCGINFITRHAFFTKNGILLGIAFTNIRSNRLYPSVGMKRAGENLRVNFGQTQFVYDIDSYVQIERKAIMDDINRTPVNALCPPLNETQLTHKLIAQYLAHDGYIETARAFAEEVQLENHNLAKGTGDAINGQDLEPEEDHDAIHRQQIRSAILEGDIDKALKFTNTYYQAVLRENENIYFKLRCRKFIEMIRSCAELSDGTSPVLSPAKQSLNSSHDRNDDYNGVFDHQMELDEQLGIPHHNGMARNRTWEDGAMDTSEDSTQSYSVLMQKTLEYGIELKAEFDQDRRREVKTMLKDTLALIAYTDPRSPTSPLCHLLADSERIPVAEELNGSILVSLGKSSSSALERLFAHTDILLNMLGNDGGPGALINLKSKPEHQGL